MTRRFAAPRETIFRAWTDPAELAQWFGPKGIEPREVKIDLRPGGRYSLTMHGTEGIYPLSGVYRDVKPPERLVFTWVWGHGDAEGLEMLVTIEFAETRDGGTLLTITHERLPNAEASEHHNQGWIGCLESLQEHLAR
jgi:uncharacterized protein YndB with AHSA1/START domain